MFVANLENLLILRIFCSFFGSFFVPIIIFVSIAVVLGFGLAFLGEKLNVKKDVRLDEIKEHLAGANCGGCGYAGCAAFAEALLHGDTTLEACNPTAAESKEEIAKILGLKIQKGEPKVAVVHCKGGKNCKDKGGYLGYGDCKSANMLSGGTKACEVGCMGLGSCVDECAYDVIYVDKNHGYATVTPNCVACGACLRECPKRLIGFIPAKAKVFVACSNKSKGKSVTNICSVGCIACGLCERACKFDAIKVVDGLPIIDYKKCTGCGECVSKCPRNTIVKR